VQRAQLVPEVWRRLTFWFVKDYEKKLIEQINNTASSKVVGVVNGLSTSAAALAKLLGPTVGKEMHSFVIFKKRWFYICLVCRQWTAFSFGLSLDISRVDRYVRN
jgi:hypothetical protein